MKHHARGSLKALAWRRTADAVSTIDISERIILSRPSKISLTLRWQQFLSISTRNDLQRNACLFRKGRHPFLSSSCNTQDKHTCPWSRVNPPSILNDHGANHQRRKREGVGRANLRQQIRLTRQPPTAHHLRGRYQSKKFHCGRSFPCSHPQRRQL